MSIDSPMTSSATSTPRTGNLPADHPLRTRIADAVHAVRSTTPLAQSFTNFVTINLVANAQLAAGGTAAMSYLPDDVLDVAAICGATYINVGTLLPFYKDALADIAHGCTTRASRGCSTPWRRDWAPRVPPSSNRSGMCRRPSSAATPARSSCSTACGGWPMRTPPRKRRPAPAGVESVDEVDSAIPAARRIARHLATHSPNGQGAVAVSGAVDFVTDGTNDYRLPGGSALMTKITGAGCSLGGVVGTYLAVADPLTAAMAASLHFNRAGEIAEAAAHGPGSFQTEFLDALWNVTAEQIAESAILQ